MAIDNRGTVRELYRGSVYSEVLPETVTGWKQINLTRTKKGAVRGLHGEAMSKLVTVAYGSVFIGLELEQRFIKGELPYSHGCCERKFDSTRTNARTDYLSGTERSVGVLGCFCDRNKLDP